MALKIISFIFVISLAFGIPASTQVKDVPFDVNEVLDRVNNHRQVNPRIPNPEIQTFDQGEFLVDTNVVYVPAFNTQKYPGIVFDGTNYLIVWEDDRSGSPEIYGTRVSQTGVILDPNGFTITANYYYQGSPAVAFDGTNYLVVWQDNRNNYRTDIYGARVSPDGFVIDPYGILISEAADDQLFPAIAFDGLNYLVVWEDHRSGCSIYGARINQSGIVIDHNGFTISNIQGSQGPPSITFSGTNYIVVWNDTRNGNLDIYAEHEFSQME